MVYTSERSPLRRSILSALLIILLFLLSLFTHNLFYAKSNSRLFNYGSRIKVRYRWINSTCLLLCINGSKEIFVERIEAGTYRFDVNRYLGDRVLSKVICMNSTGTSNIYGRIIYIVDNRRYSRFFTITKP